MAARPHRLGPSLRCRRMIQLNPFRPTQLRPLRRHDPPQYFDTSEWNGFRHEYSACAKTRSDCHAFLGVVTGAVVGFAHRDVVVPVSETPSEASPTHSAPAPLIQPKKTEPTAAISASGVEIPRSMKKIRRVCRNIVNGRRIYATLRAFKAYTKRLTTSGLGRHPMHIRTKQQL